MSQKIFNLYSEIMHGFRYTDEVEHIKIYTINN